MTLAVVSDPNLAIFNQNYIVAPGVTVGGRETSTANLSFVNYGNVLDDGSGSEVAGVSFTGSVIVSAKVVNFAAANITGVTGVYFGSGNDIVDNRGSIYGYGQHGIQFGSGAQDVQIRNSGTVEGAISGIAISAGSATTGTITNLAGGVISGGTYGIQILNALGGPSIVNAGTIEGPTAVAAFNGDILNLTNTGTISGNVVASTLNAADTVTNSGKITGNVTLGSGADHYTGSGNGTAHSVLGEAGADVLTGGNLADNLNGGTEGDQLNGGLGNDVLTGGANNDQFKFTTALGSTNVDTIMDFAHAADKILVDNAVMAALGSTTGTLATVKFYASAGATHGHDADDRIVYNTTNGWLYYDADGSGAGVAVHFATLSTHPTTISAGDFQII